MTLIMKDMLLDSAYLLHKSNCVSYLTDETGEIEEPSELSILLLCVNNVLSEIATDYVPCLASEDVVVTNKSFNVSNLTKNLLSIKKITDAFGKSVKIDIKNGLVILPNGVYTIEYCYLPAKGLVSSIITDFPSYITSRVVVQGIVAEYYLVTGQYEEAKMWQERFNQSIQLPATKLKNIVMRGRKW